MKKISHWLVIPFLLMSILLASNSYACGKKHCACELKKQYCGHVLKKKIYTYGKLSCAQARGIYYNFAKYNKVPQGWTCGQSVGGCGKGKDVGFVFK